MKKTDLLLLPFGILFILGCQQVPDSVRSDIPVIDSENADTGVVECTAASDCVVGGCSGTVCQNKDAPPVFTTCEYREEYACYESIDCGCVAGKCQWETTSEFEQCVEKARS